MCLLMLIGCWGMLTLSWFMLIEGQLKFSTIKKPVKTGFLVLFQRQ